MLQQIGIVALGGALGAALRYAASELIATESFPYATLSVNLVGSFLLGIVAVALTQNLLSTNLALLLGTGVLGDLNHVHFLLKQSKCLNKVRAIQQFCTFSSRCCSVHFSLSSVGGLRSPPWRDEVTLCRTPFFTYIGSKPTLFS